MRMPIALSKIYSQELIVIIFLFPSQGRTLDYISAYTYLGAIDLKRMWRFELPVSWPTISATYFGYGYFTYLCRQMWGFFLYDCTNANNNTYHTAHVRSPHKCTQKSARTQHHCFRAIVWRRSDYNLLTSGVYSLSRRHSS